MASTPSSSLAFLKVNRCEPELVTPTKPTPKELKLLSDIDDQEGLRFQIPVIFFYKNSNNDKPLVKLEEGPIRVIREALGTALVYYYPFAGRLREGSNKKLMVDCTGEGVLFVAAKADVELKQLGDAIRPPCPFLDEFLYNVPGSDGILDCPLLLIQVTQLNCGGFALAVRFNHTMCDAFGLVQFLNTVADMARGINTPSTHPVWQREILNARNPPRITYTHLEYQQIPSNSNGSNNKNMVMDPNDVVQRSFFFSPNQIMNMRRQLPKHLRNCSRFELITACMWKCRTIALGLDPEDTVRMSCVTSIRGNKNVTDFSLPSGYYGNAFANPAVASNARVLCESPLGFAVELVKKAKAQMNKDYIMSVASLMVIRGRPSFKVSGNYIVSDNTRAGFGEVDFGWGFPVFGGPAMALSLISFHVPYEERGEKGVAVPICLPTEIAMERFGQELKKIANHDLEEKPYKMCELKGFNNSSSF